MLKKCSKCKLEKDTSEYNKHNQTPTGLTPRCKACLAVGEKVYYDKNKQKWRDSYARQLEQDPEKLRKRCRESAARWRSNPDNIRRKKMAYILKRYGISFESYEQMEKDQNGLCKICGNPPDGRFDRLHVDHDHITGEVRGLLCFSCNTGLGNFKDNFQTLQSAANYLLSRLPSQSLP